MFAPPQTSTYSATHGGWQARPVYWRVTAPAWPMDWAKWLQPGSMTRGVSPVSPRRSRAVLLRRVHDGPRLLPAAGQGGRGGRLRLDGGARQHLLPTGVRRPVPLQP